MRYWLVVAMTVLGCAGAANHDASAAGTVQRSSIVDSLSATGLTLQDAGMVQQPFFAAPAHVYQIDGRDLQIYEFSSSAEAEKAAADVSPTGSSIGTSMVTWMAAPHFFRRDRVIVNYIGTSERVLTELARLLGPQFAGR